ncbi:hypothetical protein OAO55_00820 [Bacteroidales bacterium]|nr:hypothetical protein [Bacteroidales bacterium]
MKNKIFLKPIAILVLLFVILSCFAEDNETINHSDKKEQVIILCLIEYDLSELENKNIQGVELFLNTERRIKNIRIPRSYQPKEKGKYYKFICTTGKFGKYEVFYRENNIMTSTDHFVGMSGDLKLKYAEQDNTLLRVNASSNGIICIGKLKVKYKGGAKEGGTIDYTYEFEKHYNDTIALHAFCESQPELFEKYKNQVYYFDR